MWDCNNFLAIDVSVYIIAWMLTQTRQKYGVGILTTRMGALKQKTVIATTKFTSKLLLMGPPPIAAHFSPRSYDHRSASAKFAAALFLVPPPDPSRRPPGWGWGRAALSLPLADSPIMRTLSKMVKNRGENRYERFAQLNSLLLLVLCIQLALPLCRLPGEL